MPQIEEKPIHDMDSYNIGNTDVREWGWYAVLSVGVDNNAGYCEKTISINPRQALSLQRHKGRCEIWTVIEGQLDAIINGEYKKLLKGESIMVPQYSIHCMI